MHRFLACPMRMNARIIHTGQLNRPVLVLYQFYALIHLKPEYQTTEAIACNGTAWVL